MRTLLLKHLLLFVFLSFTFIAVSQNVVLSRKSVWKYLDDGSNQDTMWRNVLFNDNSWKSGAAILGYGDTKTYTTYVNSGCGNVVPSPTCKTKFITTYFRKEINIPVASDYESFTFNILRDDGAVVYINGVEAFRTNMPKGTIKNTTLASALGNQSTYYKYVIPAAAFKSGKNTIAVEIHQEASSSSDITFDMEIIANYPVIKNAPTLSRGPYLNMGNQNGIVLRWRTNIAATSKVELGTAYGYYIVKTIADATMTKEHIVKVTGLLPNTKYWYRISSGGAVLQGGELNFFVTAPDALTTQKMTFAAFGDCGRLSATNQNATYASYKTFLSSNNMTAPDAWLLMGDNAYMAGTDGEYTKNFFDIYGDQILKNHIVFPVPGNHDYANSTSNKKKRDIPYYKNFSMPQNGECGGLASGRPSFYSWDWGNVHFLALDSYGLEDDNTTIYDTLLGKSSQMDWIRKDLAANTKKWVIAYWHHPPYTMGSHNSDKESDLTSIREKTIRILERLGVDMIICGHSHVYERTKLINGHYGTENTYIPEKYEKSSSSGKYDGTANSCPYITNSDEGNKGVVYVVAGSAGSSLGSQSSFPHEAMRGFSYKETGFFFFEVEDNRLDAKFIVQNNTLRDRFTIIKNANKTTIINAVAGQPVNLSASWPGVYNWSLNGEVTRSINYISQKQGDTTITVKDKTNGTCLSDNFIIKTAAANVLKSQAVQEKLNIDTARISALASRSEDIANDKIIEKEEVVDSVTNKFIYTANASIKKQDLIVTTVSQSVNQLVLKINAPADYDLKLTVVTISGTVLSQQKVKATKGDNYLPVALNSSLITVVSLWDGNQIIYSTKVLPK